MNGLSTHQRAVELLQQLGFKEYEAKCFVALTQLSKGTAKDVSRTCDVPRTRVYDAIRVLESKGLVEIQHTNPQQFRAVPLDEAVKLLREEYEERTDHLADVLERLEPENQDTDGDPAYEVWSLSSATTIANRAEMFVQSASREVVLIIGTAEALTPGLINGLQAAKARSVDVAIGTVTDDLRERVEAVLPTVDSFTSTLQWLHSSPEDPDDDVQLSRLLLVDRNTILVSSVHHSGADDETEKAIVGRGFDNGLVVVARRMMAMGLPHGIDPGQQS